VVKSHQRGNSHWYKLVRIIGCHILKHFEVFRSKHASVVVSLPQMQWILKQSLLLPFFIQLFCWKTSVRRSEIWTFQWQIHNKQNTIFSLVQ